MRAALFLSRKMVDNKPGRRFKGIERPLFIGMHRNVTDATEIFRIPRNRIVELGAHIELESGRAVGPKAPRAPYNFK